MLWQPMWLNYRKCLYNHLIINILKRAVSIRYRPFKDVLNKNYIALVTLLERRHLEQTLMVFGVPLTIALTFLKFGLQVLLVLLWEWLTLIPKTKPFPQTAHFAIYRTPPVCSKNNNYKYIKQHQLSQTVLQSKTSK